MFFGEKMIFRSIARQLIPSWIRKDALYYSYAKNLIGSAIIAAFATPGFALLYYYLGFHLAFYMLLLLGTIIIGTVAFFKRIKSFFLVREIITGSVYVCLAWLSYALGGVFSAASFWLIIPPLLAIFYGSLRSGFIWLVLCIATIIVLSGAMENGFNFPATPVNNELLLQTVSICGLILVIFALAYFFERGKQEAALQIQEADRKLRAKEKVELMAKKAEDASLAKSAFLAMMSHEIRTPLNGVLGMTGLLSETPLTSEQREYAHVIRVSGEALLTVINDILDFSKVESGKLEFENSNFQIKNLIDEAIGIVNLQANAKGDTLKTQLDPNVPLWVSGDPSRIRQVLINLLMNAVKFTEFGSIELNVKLIQKDEASQQIMLLFSVIDTGIGMDQNVRDKLFQPFSQGDASTSRKYGGTGLGLAISKRLVELMHGEIGVESHVGQGSKFWFKLPLKEAQPENENDDIEEQQNTQRLQQKQSARILLVDDVATNVQVGLRILNRLGYHADAVGNGFEAVQAIRFVPYDLILMDCQMPEMDGYEATKSIRKMKNHKINRVPIIAMTAHALKGDKEKCLAAGMDDYISKPIDLKEIEIKIEKWLGKSANDSYFSWQDKINSK